MSQKTQRVFDLDELRNDQEFRTKAIELIDKVGLRAAKIGSPLALREIGSNDQELTEFMDLVLECYQGREAYASVVAGW